MSRTLFGLVLAALAGAGPISAQESDGIQTDSILENGLRVTVLENRDVPMVTALLAVRAGAFTQADGEEGLAHMFEHLLFSTYGGDPGDFGQDAGELNAWYNGTTGADVVTYFLVLPSEETEDAIRLLARLVDDPDFREEDLRRELPIVFNELALDQANPVSALRRRVAASLWGGAWHAYDMAGDSASLNAITVEKLEQYFDRYYVPNNAVLLVTGDADPEDVFDWADDRFDDWDRGPDPPALPTLEPPTQSAAVLVGDDVLELTVHVRVRAPGTGSDPEAVRRIEALVEVLNAPDGPLQQALVTNGPLQRLSVSLVARSVGSTIVFEGTAAPDEAVAGAQRMLVSLDQLGLAVAGPSDQSGTPDDPAPTVGLDETIATAEKRWRLDLALTLERTARIAPYMADLWGRGGGEYLFDESPFESASSAEELRSVAEQYVVGQPRSIGILGPHHLVEELQAIFAGGR